MNDDDIWRRREVDSPCIKICVLHPEAGLCIGCYRSIEEISNWANMPAEARRAVIAELPRRAPLLARRRGGNGRARARGAGQNRGE